MDRRNTLLYPLMVIAAASVTLLSVLGIAAMTGHLPNAFSPAEPAPAQHPALVASLPGAPAAAEPGYAPEGPQPVPAPVARSGGAPANLPAGK